MYRSEESSLFDFSLDVGVELLPADGLSVIATHSVNDLPELVLIVAVFQLLVDVFKVGDGQLALAFNVQ